MAVAQLVNTNSHYNQFHVQQNSSVSSAKSLCSDSSVSSPNGSGDTRVEINRRHRFKIMAGVCVPPNKLSGSNRFGTMRCWVLAEAKRRICTLEWRQQFDRKARSETWSKYCSKWFQPNFPIWLNWDNRGPRISVAASSRKIFDVFAANPINYTYIRFGGEGGLCVIEIFLDCVKCPMMDMGPTSFSFQPSTNCTVHTVQCTLSFSPLVATQSRACALCSSYKSLIKSNRICSMGSFMSETKLSSFLNSTNFNLLQLGGYGVRAFGYSTVHTHRQRHHQCKFECITNFETKAKRKLIIE